MNPSEGGIDPADYSAALKKLDKDHPAPNILPSQGGLAGAFFSVVNSLLFASFAGLDAERFWIAIAILAALSFAVPFLLIRAMWRSRDFYRMVMDSQLALEAKHRAERRARLYGSGQDG